MPTYSYECRACLNRFELFSYIKDYKQQPQCPRCRKYQTNRLYLVDVATQNCSIKKSDSELKTIGDLANRNRDKLTNEQKTELYNQHNAYKLDQPATELPKGVSRIKKSSKKNKWTK
jgi:putative FmdB family regulatory protein